MNFESPIDWHAANHQTSVRRFRQRGSACQVRAQQESSLGTTGLAAAISGLVAAPVVLISEYTLATTGNLL